MEAANTSNLRRIGHTTTIDTFLRALGRRFNADVEPKVAPKQEPVQNGVRSGV